MNDQPKLFRRKDTGEEQEFTPHSYRNELTSMRDTHRQFAHFHCYVAADGYRIDKKPDGSFKDKWGVEWEEVPN